MSQPIEIPKTDMSPLVKSKPSRMRKSGRAKSQLLSRRKCAGSPMSQWSDLIVNTFGADLGVFWRLGSGGLDDQGPDNRDGSVVGTLTVGGESSMITGDSNGATAFGGSGAIALASYDPFAVAGKATFVIVANSDDLSANRMLIKDGGSGISNVAYACRLSGVRTLRAFVWGGGSVDFANAFAAAGSKALLFLEFDDTNNTVRCWSNNSEMLVGGNPGPHSLAFAPASGLALGHYLDGFSVTANWLGKMDEFIVVERGLTSGERTALYDGYQGNFADTTPPTANLVSTSRTRISRQSGADATDIVWTSNENFTNYMLRAVSTSGSAYTTGTLIEQDQNPSSGGAAGTEYTSTITDDELVAAGLSGTIKVKLFTRDAAGNWST